MIEITLAIAVVAPVLAALAITLAVIDHVRAPEDGDWWFVGCLAVFVIAAIPFSPFGFDYRSADLPYVWRIVTCAIVVLPAMLLRVVSLLTGRRESRAVLVAGTATVVLVGWLLLMPTFPGPSHDPAPTHYTLAFAAFGLLYLASFATCIVWLSRSLRGALGPARARGTLLLATFAPLGALTGAWLAAPTESTEFAWSAAAFLVSIPFWLAMRAPRSVFQLFAGERDDPADGVARLVRSDDVRADLPLALRSTLRAWGLRRVQVVDGDGVLVERLDATTGGDERAMRRIEIDGVAGGMRLLLDADTLSPTLRPADRATLTLLATSIQLAFDRERAATREQAAASKSKAAAWALEEANERMQLAAAAQDRFLSVVTQQLQEPAGALLGLTRIGETSWSELPAEQLQPLQQLVARRAERLASTVEQLLLAESVEHGTLLRGRERCDVREVLEAAARDANVASFEVDGEDAADCCTVETDPLALRHIFAALIDNATRHGADPVEVSISREHEQLRVEVADHGHGIRDGFASVLFHRYTRDSDPQEPGVGLGLAIASELGRAVGASLRYRRERSRTVFEVLLPVTP